MRRSKALPSKTVRRYRKVSQRRMTTDDDHDEAAEMERLRHLLATHPLTRHEQQMQAEDKEESNTNDANKNGDDQINLYDGVLDPSEQPDMYGTDDTPLILASTKKKKKTASRIILTPAEIKQARAERKKLERKLRQLQDRKAQKERRQALYAKLEEHSVANSAVPRHLLQSSAQLGHKRTARELLQYLLEKEKAGLTLTEEEQNQLYQDRRLVDDDGDDCMTERVDIPPAKKAKVEIKESFTESSPTKVPSSSKLPSDIETQGASKDSGAKLPTAPASQAASSFAAQMMASLQKLKETSTKPTEDNTRKDDSLNQLAKPKKKDRYVPTAPAVLKTAASLGLTSSAPQLTSTAVQNIKRPAHVEEARQSLPVTTMEFELMDAIRNNSVTILCSETGSGKSTQTPQFLYEHGYAASGMIGITQPRRVAAVSTAKRVAYEMGCGNGHIIPNASSNLVAYQTRYETAGLGNDTRIKFMTDGILLKEIQSDLLLRQYSVIVLDEAHERNLNTDVLIGLLSVALPLRQQASEEPGSTIQPLRLVIMSATLRVQDFTDNPRLFATTRPAVVQVPGRTFPVTIHHAKHTALDDYEDAALQKIVKIHRKLPAGGILVFLTGKQEILRMVRRLEKSLNPTIKKNAKRKDMHHEPEEVALNESNKDNLRDMDDEEMDGDVFKDGLHQMDDFDEMEQDEVDGVEESTPVTEPTEDSDIPKKVIVLPLYSLLSAEDQAKVFRPVPEGHRLIVVATNIAETVSLI